MESRAVYTVAEELQASACGDFLPKAIPQNR
jgi:hypothetical protein